MWNPCRVGAYLRGRDTRRVALDYYLPMRSLLFAGAAAVRGRLLAILVAVTLAGCAATPRDVPPPGAPMTAAEGRALVARRLPEGTPERNGWAPAPYAALGALEIAPTAQNICAAIAIIQQESGFRVDPAVPGLAAIAKKEIEAGRERTGVPRLVHDAALALPSSNGKSYGERLDGVKTEMQMSDLFEEFIGRVTLGRTVFDGPISI